MADHSTGTVKEPDAANSQRPFKSAKTWLELALLIFGLVAVPLAIKTWLEGQVEKSVEKTLNDEAILRKIAAHSRPSLIFNAKESIITDMGAVQYIKPDDIHVTKRTSDKLPQHVHIGFRRPISIPPILTSLYDTTQITSERGKGLDWEFEIEWIVQPVGKEDKDILYRMEIVP